MSFWGIAYNLTFEDDGVDSAHYIEKVVIWVNRGTNAEDSSAYAALRDYADVNGYRLEKVGNAFVQIEGVIA